MLFEILVTGNNNNFVVAIQAIYEACLLYFGIREQKQILVIENHFIVFQNILH